MKHTTVPATRAVPGNASMLDGARFLLGDWLVDVAAHRLERGDTVVALEPRPMALLAELCRHANAVVSADALLEACWPGQDQGDHQVHKVIAGLYIYWLPGY